MIDPKLLYWKVLEEHLHDLQMSEIIHLNPYGHGWQDSRTHILELMGFKKEEIDTSAKVIKIIEKYQEDIKSWRQRK